MRLRVLDFGFVSALRSQAVYHGVADTITPDGEPVLTLVNPDTPYVCVGVHQEIGKEVDEAFCAANGLPVYRRHVGGGAVYLDRNIAALAPGAVATAQMVSSRSPLM